jgi:hypothetical protein
VRHFVPAEEQLAGPSPQHAVWARIVLELEKSFGDAATMLQTAQLSFQDGNETHRIGWKVF